MVTGYTADVVDGKIKTLGQFAKQCMKAFVPQMRDLPIDAGFVPAVPDEYYDEKVQELEQDLAELQQTTEEELWAQRQASLKADLKCYMWNRRQVVLENRRIRKMLVLAKDFVPPTKDHNGIKLFMIEQLETTLQSHYPDKWDSYIDALKKQINEKMPKNYKAKLIKAKEKELRKAYDERTSEIKKCELMNEWCETFLSAVGR
jgi:hypothetical protein